MSNTDTNEFYLLNELADFIKQKKLDVRQGIADHLTEVNLGHILPEIELCDDEFCEDDKIYSDIMEISLTVSSNAKNVIQDLEKAIFILYSHMKDLGYIANMPAQSVVISPDSSIITTNSVSFYPQLKIES